MENNVHVGMAIVEKGQKQDYLSQLSIVSHYHTCLQLYSATDNAEGLYVCWYCESMLGWPKYHNLGNFCCKNIFIVGACPTTNIEHKYFRTQKV